MSKLQKKIHALSKAMTTNQRHMQTQQIEMHQYLHSSLGWMFQIGAGLMMGYYLGRKKSVKEVVSTLMTVSLALRKARTTLSYFYPPFKNN